MRIPAVIPIPAQIGREALIVVAGALLAAFIMSNWPAGKAYVKKAWA
jgi:hypothetical protein